MWREQVDLDIYIDQVYTVDDATGQELTRLISKFMQLVRGVAWAGLKVH